MGTTSIANLAVKLTASAEDFDKEIGRAEKRLTGFMNTLASPLNLSRGIGGSLISSIVNPVGGLMTDVSRFVSAIPGFGAQERLLDPSKHAEAMHDAFERTQRLVRESERLDVSPRFLRAIEGQAEDDAAAVIGALQKFNKALGELRSGSVESWKTFKEHGLEPEEFLKAGQEEAILKFADHYQQLGDRALQAAEAVTFLGKGGIMAHGAFKDGAAGIQHFMDKLDKLRLYGKKDSAGAEAFEKVDRLAKLMQEAAEQRAFMEGGAQQMIGEAKMKAGIEGGFMDRVFGHIAAHSTNAPWHDFFANRQPKEMQAILAEDHVPKKLDLINGMPRELANEVQALSNHFQSLAGSLGKSSEEMQILGLAARGVPADQILKLNEQFRTLVEGPRKAQQFSKMADELVRLSDTFGMTTAEIKAYDASLLGATKIQQEFIKGGHERLEGAAIRLGLESPAEKLEKELNRVRDLHARGNLDDDTYQRALKRIAKGPKYDVDPRANTALWNSQEWAQAFDRVNENRPQDSDELEELRKLTAVQEDARSELRRLADNRPAPMMIPPGP